MNVQIGNNGNNKFYLHFLLNDNYLAEYHSRTDFYV